MSKAFNPKYEKWYHRHRYSKRHKGTYCGLRGGCERCSLRFSRNRRAEQQHKLVDTQLIDTQLIDIERNANGETI